MLIRGVGSALSVLGANRAMAQTPAHFALTSVALYLPEQAMRERGPTTDALIEYIDKLKARAETVLRSSPKIPGCHAAIVSHGSSVESLNASLVSDRRPWWRVPSAVD